MAKSKKCGCDDKRKCKNHAQLEFCTPIRFEQELVVTPPATTPAPFPPSVPNPGITGLLKLSFDPELTQAKFKLYVFNAVNVPANALIGAAHLHGGQAGVNGAVVVPLFAANPPVQSDGLLASGTITNDTVNDLTVNGVVYNNVVSVYNAILGRNMYVNVHGTGVFAPGMIRGQIIPDC